MPRHDWNNKEAHREQTHHKKMKSGAKGKGHDHYIRAGKQEISRAQAARHRKPRHEEDPRR